MKKILFTISITLIANFFTIGQGTLRGKITDKTGETLIGASILLKSNPSVGIVTDFDGYYLGQPRRRQLSQMLANEGSHRKHDITERKGTFFKSLFVVEMV